MQHLMGGDVLKIIQDTGLKIGLIVVLLIKIRNR